MEERKNLLIIFTRNIQLGKCKTRLARTLGPEKALEIYRQLVKHTAEISKEVVADKWVYYSEYPEKEDLFDPLIFKKFKQRGEDLGARMEEAFKQGFDSGFKKIVLIGSDIMDLFQDDLSAAFDALDHSPFVIGPARDGGYYLLGMKKLKRELLADISWGSDRVLAETLRKLQTKEYSLLDERNDIDIYEDLIGIPGLEKFLKKGKND